MRDKEIGVEERLLAGASDEVLAEFICCWRRYRFNIERRAHNRAACQYDPFAFAHSPHLSMQ